MTVDELKIDEPEWMEAGTPPSVYVGQRIAINNPAAAMVKEYLEVLEVEGTRARVVKRKNGT